MEPVKQYEIWWAALSATAGRRPVLLLSRDSAYDYLNKFAVVEITSTVRNIAVEVPLGRAEGMPSRCVANFDNLRRFRALLCSGEPAVSHPRDTWK